MIHSNTKGGQRRYHAGRLSHLKRAAGTAPSLKSITVPRWAVPAIILICDAPVFDTTSPSARACAKRGLTGRQQRSQLALFGGDLTPRGSLEPPPLLVAVAGRACLMADGSWRGKLPQLVLGLEEGALAALRMAVCLMEECSTGGSWRLQTVAFPFGAVSRQIEAAGYDRISVFFKVQRINMEQAG